MKQRVGFKKPLFYATNTWHWVSLKVSSQVRDLASDPIDPGMRVGAGEEGRGWGEEKPSGFLKEKRKLTQGTLALPCSLQLSTHVWWGGAFINSGLSQSTSLNQNYIYKMGVVTEQTNP